MNKFETELVKLFGAKKLAKIQSLTVGIIGAGGLGSNAAFNLVRSGFNSFVIADFDKIEVSNLNRQFYFQDQVGTLKVAALKENLFKINPDSKVEVIKEEITADNISHLFKKCDIIIEACDRVVSKKLVVEEFINSAKLLVSASGLAGWGNTDEIKTKQVNRTTYLVGDFKTEVGVNTPPMSPKVNLVAAKQADIILDYVLEGENE